jgi:ferric enterobactin receptor
MKVPISVLILCLSCSITYCQQSRPVNAGSNKISGKVIDTTSKQGIANATITLFDGNTRKMIASAAADNTGSFHMQNIRPGIYRLEIGSIGYAPYIKNELILKDEDKVLPIMNVYLEKEVRVLQGVTVTGTHQPIENKIDKLVYHLDKDITSQGGVATDALKKIPGVTVDVNGNVELLGNSSIRFLVDGKPSGIFGNNPAEALQSIPASQIQSIEIMTSPSAKYDATGTAGIINIILKKSKIEGFNGNTSLAAGTRLENGSLNLAWNHGKLGLNAFFSGNAQLRGNTPTGLDRTASNDSGTITSQLTQQSVTNFSRNGYQAGLNMDLAVSNKDNLSVTLGYHHFDNMNDGNTDQVLIAYDSSGNKFPGVNSILIFNNRFTVNTFDNSISFRRKFKKDKQELEITYSGSFGSNKTYYGQLQRYNTGAAPFAGSNSQNPGIDNEADFSLDYTHPVNSHFLLETGVKTILQSIISDANVLTLDVYSGNYTKDDAQSYTSAYHRTIYAGYADASFSLFDYLDLKAGCRYEYTIGKANYSNVQNPTIPRYSNIAPSLVISHSLPNKQTLKFSYSYRLERPDYRDLNPFMNLSDPHNITTGNPNLQPEIGHNFHLAYNRSYETGANINILLLYEKNSPDIKPYIIYYPAYKIGDSTYPDVTLTTREDISSEIKTGVSIFLSLPIGKELTLRPNLMFYNRSFKNISANPPSTSSFGYRLNMNAACQFGKEWASEVFGNYNSGTQWQGRQPSSFSYTFALRRQFLNNKTSFGIVAVNAFSKYIPQKSFLVAQNVISNSYRDIPYRSFGVTCTYKFGRIKFSKPKETDNYLYSPPPVEN